MLPNPETKPAPPEEPMPKKRQPDSYHRPHAGKAGEKKVSWIISNKTIERLQRLMEHYEVTSYRMALESAVREAAERHSLE